MYHNYKNETNDTQWKNFEKSILFGESQTIVFDRGKYLQVSTNTKQTSIIPAYPHDDTIKSIISTFFSLPQQYSIRKTFIHFIGRYMTLANCSV